MKDIDNSSFEHGAISMAELAQVSGGAGEWAAHTDDVKSRLGPLFEAPTPELKTMFCGLAARQAGKNHKNDDGSPATAAQRVEAAKGTRALCLRSRRLPIGEIIP